MEQNETKKIADTEETGNTDSNDGGVATKVTKTTLPGCSETGESEANVIPIRSWPPESLRLFPEVAEMILNLVHRFFPFRSLLELTTSELQRIHEISAEESKAIAEDAFLKAAKYWAEESNGSAWPDKLDLIFDGAYPEKARESWSNGLLCGQRYGKAAGLSDKPYSYRVWQVDPIPAPKTLLCEKIAPDLFTIGTNRSSVSKTADVERFINGDKKAVPRSSLHEEVICNRPTYGAVPGWQPYDDQRLPCKVVTVELLGESPVPGLLDEFVADLGREFAWPEGKQPGTSFLASYLGYLIQPMLSHLSIGQMPAYAFLGPTKSGKGFLSNALPSLLYHQASDSTVITKQLTKENYEFEVLMDAARNALFLCFDEVKNASDAELKIIDAFCTQSSIQIRKFRVGYYQLPNLYTVSLTAVHRTFTDESYGRLAVIQLKESRSDSITSFYQKWRCRGPELLRALFERINKVGVDLENLPKIPDRRPGFGLMAQVIERAFGMKPDYSIETASNDVLDDLCRLHESETATRSVKGKWFRYSPRSFTDFMATNHEVKWKKSNAIAAINTALGYTSTRHHPSYKITGYPAESGRHYHIEIREEGESNKRVFIYIQDLDERRLSSTKPIATTNSETSSQSQGNSAITRDSAEGCSS